MRGVYTSEALPGNGCGDLGNSIAENAAGFKSASGDSGSASQHSLPDQIAADRYLAAKRANRGLPFRRVQLRPGGNADLRVLGSGD